MTTTALALATSAFTTSALAQNRDSSSGRWSQKACTTGMPQTGWYPLPQSVPAFGVTLLFMPIASLVSIPDLTKRGYPESLILGTLAGSATLGLLIPPSIVPIVYCVATEQSIARMFIAGMMLITLFAGYTAVRASVDPDLIPTINQLF